MHNFWWYFPSIILALFKHHSRHHSKTHENYCTLSPHPLPFQISFNTEWPHPNLFPRPVQLLHLLDDPFFVFILFHVMEEMNYCLPPKMTCKILLETIIFLKYNLFHFRKSIQKLPPPRWYATWQWQKWLKPLSSITFMDVIDVIFAQHHLSIVWALF